MLAELKRGRERIEATETRTAIHGFDENYVTVEEIYGKPYMCSLSFYLVLLQARVILIKFGCTKTLTQTCIFLIESIYVINVKY
jgi:hypothetical protein